MLFGKNTGTKIKLKTGFVFITAVMLFLIAGCSGKKGGTSPDDTGTSPSGEAEVSFSLPSGMYDEETLTVELTAPEGYEICYTTDGTVPTIDDCTGERTAEVTLDNKAPGYLISRRNEMLYPEFPEQTILENEALPSGRIIWAALADENGNISGITANVYFPGSGLYGRYPDTLIISMIADPEDLLNYDTGIMASGRVYDEWRKTPEAAKVFETGEWWYAQTNSTQHGKDWERPCTIQIYDGEKLPAVSEAAGIRMTGGISRRLSQRSFNVYMREEYGSSRLGYELFDGTGDLKGFRIRSGGNNAEHLKFKDAYLMELCEDRAVDMAKTTKAVLFINGEYWGPYLISERITSQMLSSRYGIDEEQVVIIKEGEVEEGTDEDIRLYDELMAFADRDMSDPEVYGEFCELVDVQSFADYCAIQIYIGNKDWSLNKNDILWRTRDDSCDGGKWHFMLYDIEGSAGTYGHENTASQTDHFRAAVENYPLFGAAIRNDEFYKLFLEAVKEIGSENFSPERTEDVLGRYLRDWMPLMNDYYLRYGDHRFAWDVNIRNTRDFFKSRYDFIIPIIENYNGGE